MRAHRPPAQRCAGLAVALAVAIFLAAPQAAAHADLATSQPTQGSRLDAAPTQAVVTFTEAVDPVGTGLQVLDAHDKRVDLGDLQVSKSPPMATVGLPPTLPPGAYRLAWRALSATDGHATMGTVGFAIGAFAPPDAGPGAAFPTGSAIARFLEYAGFSLAFGAAAFLLWMRPAGFPSQAARIGLFGGATLHAAGTLLLAANTAATSIPFDKMAGSDVGRVLLLRMVLAGAAWLLALVWTLRPVAGGTAIVTALLLGSALGTAWLGHPAGAGPATMALDFVHLVSAATWVGGLALLLFLVWQAERKEVTLDQLRAAGVRFGTLALTAVAVLALSGVVIAVAVLGIDRLAHPLQVLESPWGLFLAGKIVLAAGMVALAAVNRYVLLEEPADAGLAARMQRTAHIATGGRLKPGLAAHRFRRTLAIEASMGVAVLVLAGLLTSVSPPSAAAAAPGLTIEGQGRFYLAQAKMEPPHVGGTSPMTLSILPVSAADAPVTNNTCGSSACVSVSLLYNGTSAPESHTAIARNGAWQVSDIVWSHAGHVTATVTISTQDHYEDNVVLRFTVAP